MGQIIVPDVISISNKRSQALKVKKNILRGLEKSRNLPEVVMLRSSSGESLLSSNLRNIFEADIFLFRPERFVPVLKDNE